MKPWHKRYPDTVKEHTSPFIHFHCCDSIDQLLDDLIYIGVDAINPVQDSARDMDSSTLDGDDGACGTAGLPPRSADARRARAQLSLFECRG